MLALSPVATRTGYRTDIGRTVIEFKRKLIYFWKYSAFDEACSRYRLPQRCTRRLLRDKSRAKGTGSRGRPASSTGEIPNAVPPGSAFAHNLLRERQSGIPPSSSWRARKKNMVSYERDVGKILPRPQMDRPDLDIEGLRAAERVLDLPEALVRAPGRRHVEIARRRKLRDRVH